MSNAPANNGKTCYNAGFSGFYNPAPRDNIIGPGAWNDDFSIYKHFKIAEKVDLRFAADFFNFTNHPNDPAPNPSTGLQDISQQDRHLEHLLGRSNCRYAWSSKAGYPHRQRPCSSTASVLTCPPHLVALIFNFAGLCWRNKLHHGDTEAQRKNLKWELLGLIRSRQGGPLFSW